MTNTPDNTRLDRIEALLLQTATQLNQTSVRLDQTAAIQQINTQAISRLEANQEVLQQAVQQVEQQLEASVAHLVGLIGDFVEEAHQDRAVIRELQSEVRGIQTENQRILQYLFGQE